jgi:hypothetical protein
MGCAAAHHTAQPRMPPGRISPAASAAARRCSPASNATDADTAVALEAHAGAAGGALRCLHEEHAPARPIRNT